MQENQTLSNDNANLTEEGKLFVGNLSYFCVENHLLELFAPYGSVVHAEIRRTDRRGESKQSLLHGFVTMASREEAVSVMEHLHNQLFMGRKLR